MTTTTYEEGKRLAQAVRAYCNARGIGQRDDAFPLDLLDLEDALLTKRDDLIREDIEKVRPVAESLGLV